MHFFLVLPTYKLSVVLFMSGKNAFVCIEVTTSLTFKESFDVINKLHEIIFLLRIKIVALIVFRYIAMITKQKSFNKSLVDRNSQVIFLDEAHAGLLDADDWKILSQGGLTAHDRKYQKTTPTVIRCSMFLTCQKELDFSEDNNAAMDVRLRKFYFRSLTAPPVAHVQQYLKDNAMDCLVWASREARTPNDELPPPVPGPSLGQNGIADDERERIRSFRLEDSESDSDASEDVEQSVSAEDSSEEGETEEGSGTSSTGGWEKTLEKITQLRNEQPCHSLKQRQLGLIAAGVRRAVHERDSEVERAQMRVLEETKQRWISLGMIKEQDAHLLVSVEGPYHPTIERSREEYFARKKEQDQRMLEEKARDYYRDDWVLDKEHELRQLQKQEDAATDDDVKRAQEYMIQLTVDALKSRFQRNEVPGLSKLVLLERRKRAVEMKWLSVKQAQQIHSIWSPLPYPCDDQEDESDDEELFITQSTPPMARSQHSQVERSQQNRNSQKRRSQKGDDRTTPVPKKGRITHFFPTSQK